MNSNAVRQTSERRIIKSLHSFHCWRHFNECGVLPAAHCACRAFSLWMLSCPQSGGFRNNAGAWQGVGLCASSFPAAFPPEFSLTQVSLFPAHIPLLAHYQHKHTPARAWRIKARRSCSSRLSVCLSVPEGAGINQLMAFPAFNARPLKCSGGAEPQQFVLLGFLSLLTAGWSWTGTGLWCVKTVNSLNILSTDLRPGL